MSTGITNPVKQTARRFRTVVADDHPEVLQEIASLLEPEFEVVRAVPGGRELIDAAADLHPDAVVTDLQMGELDGIDAASAIIGAGLSRSVVLLTMYNAPELLERAREAGIRGFVLKVDAWAELLPAMRSVISGGTYVSRSVRPGTISESSS